VPVRKNCEIYGENQPAEYLYAVIEGAVRCCRVLADGRRQINAFYFPGDIFGFETGRIHTLSAEAIVDSRLLLIKRSALAEIAARDTRVACNLWTAAASELQRAQDHAMALIMSAEERVVEFLLEIAKRETSDSEIDLPMSRADIADYLGLTIETVSRTLKQLERSAAIALPTFHRVVLRNCHGR
jgi:CRP/FNR family nitrogen fixation transcriptional regulator